MLDGILDYTLDPFYTRRDAGELRRVGDVQSPVLEFGVLVYLSQISNEVVNVR